MTITLSEPRSVDALRPGIWVSVGVHLVIGLALMLLVRPAPFAPVAPQDAIEVEILPAPPPVIAPPVTAPPVQPPVVQVPPLTPSPTTAPPVARPPIAAPPVAPSRPLPPAVAPPTTRPASPEVPPGVIRPTVMLSSKALADPRSAEGRGFLSRLGDEERAEQLCGLEAMAQLKAWRPTLAPDRVVAYAFGETQLKANRLEASGAAFRSKQRWYRLSYTCSLTPDRRLVTAFEFRAGDAIPRSEWEAHFLPPIE